ncbi:MAG: hypothetical protein IKI50_06095 [Clostridia bacterium]|nr:hypothetical protein [Clostridia bacterium]
MEGVFLRKKYNIWLYLLFVCGLLFIGMYVFLNIVDSEATGVLLIFLIVGILTCLFVIPCWLLNLGAFIKIDEDSIQAKYHWFGNINGKLSNVTFAVARVNTLCVQFHQDKTYAVMGVGNAYELASFIRQKMPFTATKQPNVLLEELKCLKACEKKGRIYSLAGLAFMVPVLFVMLFLMGEKDLAAFRTIDWIIVAVIGVMEAATAVAVGYFAAKTKKTYIPIEKLRYEIQRSTIETKLPLPGNAVKVYADENYTGRITVFRHPHENTVYYTLQEFNQDYTLIKTYESETYPDSSQLPDFESFIDITEKVL